LQARGNFYLALTPNSILPKKIFINNVARNSDAKHITTIGHVTIQIELDKHHCSLSGASCKTILLKMLKKAATF